MAIIMLFTEAYTERPYHGIIELKQSPMASYAYSTAYSFSLVRRALSFLSISSCSKLITIPGFIVVK